MTTLHDDRPHPIPPHALLRYKENYAWFILCQESGVFGIAHFNNEPAFDRSRFVCNLSIRGKQYDYANATPIPEDFEGTPKLTDGGLGIAFEEPHERFVLTQKDANLDLEVVLTRRFNTFNFNVCRAAAPELASFQEVVTLGLNLPYNHHQQGLYAKGQVKLLDTGEVVKIEGYAYRDHSWVFRGDNIFLQHTWTGIQLPGVTIGVKTGTMIPRPDQWAKEGYVADAKGVRALRSIRTVPVGEGPDGQPAMLRHELKDVFGQVFTVEHDIAKRHAHVPLLSEHAGKAAPYFIVENFCPVKLLETGETGVSLLELGRKRDHLGRPDRPVFGG